MDTSASELDIDQRLAELGARFDDLRSRCHESSAGRVARESARLARENRRLVPYLSALFRLMNNAQGQLDPAAGKEAAMEAIAYLESPERARDFQADASEQEYFDTVAWMSACAYDNLATHVATMQGYNSEGMHQCITDGIGVCRRTGKLRCVTCFREYASAVYLASDDLPMALHFARMVKSLPEDSPSSERRWVGARDETWLTLLQGDLANAEECAQAALRLARSYHTPLGAEKSSAHDLETIRLLAGRPAGTPTPAGDGAADNDVPRGEWIEHDLRCDQVAALRACGEGDFKKAEGLLSYWDRWLTQHQVLHNWFEVRLRLIACHVLAGNRDRAEPLAKQLSERAWQARDWLTLHRLSRLLDPAEAPSPLALLAPLGAGPFAAAGERVAVPPAAKAEAPTESDAPTPAPAAAEAPPLEATFQELVQRLDGVQDAAGRAALLADLLALPAATVTHPVDAARLLHLLSYILADDPPETRRAAWRWAQAVAAPFPQTSTVLNLLATVGDILRQDPALVELITDEELERLFRASLDVDPFQPNNHLRAGIFFLSRENLGEAERCLARSLRLDRASGPAAVRLAEVYERTERPRDALMVLDACLREGCADPAVTWQAAQLALQLNQFDALLTYLDRHEQLAPGGPWVNYYRAVGLLTLGRPDEAVAAVDEEARRAPQNALPQHILRACCLQQLGRFDEARAHLAQALDVRLADVDYLTPSGLSNLFGRLWNTVGVHLAATDPLRGRLEQRLVGAGLAPDEFFEPQRQAQEPRAGVHFYRCQVRQPLDASWATSDACLRGQEGWDHYLALWGVLAESDAEARRLVLEWQGRCAALPATVEECEESPESYTDRPGIVWQGQRWSEA